MAHYAKIETGYVTNVITVSNDVVGDYPASDAIGKAFIASIGLDGDWVECSYNANFRGCYPGIGYTYDAIVDEFVPPPLPPKPPDEETL